MAEELKEYDYYCSAHIGVCYGPVDAIRVLQVQGTFTVWTETLPRLNPGSMPGLTNNQGGTDPASPIVTNEALWFDLPRLFGEDRGGVRGLVEFYMGQSTQKMSSRLAGKYSKTQTTAPGFRNVCMLLFDNFWWGRYSDGIRPNVGNIRLQVTRMPKGLDASLAEIPNTGVLRYEVDRSTGNDLENTNTVECPHPPDANPAHVIYEVLTNRDWGMGLSSSSIDLASFTDAAQTFQNEGMGVSFVWSGTASVDALLKDMAEVTQSMILVDKVTGKWTLKPLRGDYDPADPNIPTVAQENSIVTNYSTISCGQLANEVVVKWTDPVNGKTFTAKAQDMAGINGAGRVISVERDYYMVANLPLAYRLAWRDLRQISHARKQMTVTCNRLFDKVRPGDVVRVNWPEYAIDNQMFRVVSVNYGSKGNLPITMTLMEDVFALDAPDQATISPPVWNSTLTNPTPMDTVKTMELPLFMVADRALQETEAVLGMFGLDSASDCAGFVAAVETATGDYESLEVLTQADHATTGVALAFEAETQETVANLISGFVGYLGPELNNVMILGDPGGEHEIVVISAYDEQTDTLTLVRGSYDTVPKEWPAGTDIWFRNGYVQFDIRTRAFLSPGSVNMKALTKTGLGVLDPSQATAIPVTFQSRHMMPIRPANIVTRGTAYPAQATLDVDEPVQLTWANRNRITETTSPAPKWTDPTVAPETGQVTRVELLDSDASTVLETYEAVEGATELFMPTNKINGPGMRYLRFYSVRGAYTSFIKPVQALNVTVQTGIDCSETGLQNYILNAYVHLRPDDSNLVTTSGTKVIAVADPWGLHNMDSTDGPQYVDQINGLNVLTFASDRLKLPWDGTADEMTIAIVFTTTNTESKSDWWSSPMLFGREVIGYVRDFGCVINNGHLSFVAGSASGQNDGLAVVNDGNPHIAIIRWKTDGTFDVRVDGAADRSGTTGTGTRDAMAEVYWGYTGGSAFNGKVAETLLWTSWAEDGKAQTIEGYLAHKWGITLPIGHPYESGTPCA